MKYVEYILEKDGEKKDLRTVDISEKDAKEMNADNMHGDGMLQYRKLEGKVTAPDKSKELLDGKGYHDWSIKKLKVLAEKEGIELLTEKNKTAIWEKILKELE